MPFFHFRQASIDGYQFTGTLGAHVIVEAADAAAANETMRALGADLDQREIGFTKPRWESQPLSWEGDAEPRVYGVPYLASPTPGSIFVHYADGRTAWRPHKHADWTTLQRKGEWAWRALTTVVVFIIVTWTVWAVMGIVSHAQAESEVSNVR